jgi:pyruvate kinase
MKYRIIATLGPASQTPEIWEAMISAGATGFRLNTSHISTSQLEDWLKRLDNFRLTSYPQIDLILDLQGSKWRLGDIETYVALKGQTLVLRPQPVSNNKGILPIPHIEFFQAASKSSREILVNDAKVQLYVESADRESITAQVIRGGEISAKKGITFSESKFRRENLTDRDKRILSISSQFGRLDYAISYVKDAAEMQRYRSLIGEKVHLAAKLERKTAIQEAHEIAKPADELWICRGDLGAEIGLKGMAEVTHNFSDKISSLPIPVLLAGQVLEYMVKEPTPTRSEVCCLYDSLIKGYSGFILSDETAVGAFPVEACQAASLFLSQ